jgi:outer membrane receptor protein involved in Fe transport
MLAKVAASDRITVARSAAAAAMLLALAPAAEAQIAPSQSQTAPASNPPPSSNGQPSSSKAPTASGVTVQAKAPDYRSSIDRRSYSLTGDLATANGSLADALRNVPTLDVDPQGNLSIRGDANVTILVDGQPAPAFNGPNRGDLLQQLPANQYERVEVMTNPSAAFRPEGTGGIVNLITKKTRGEVRTASIAAAGATTQRERVSVGGVLGEPKLTLSGNAFGFSQVATFEGQQSGEIVDPASGDRAAINSASRTRQSTVGGRIYGDAVYTPDSNARLDANLHYTQFSNQAQLGGDYRSSATSGVLAQDYDYTGLGRSGFSVFSGTTTYTRQLGGADHEISLHAGFDLDDYDNDNRQLLTYQLPATRPDLYQDLASTEDERHFDVKADYKGPLPGGAKLTAGYLLEWENDANGHGGLFGVSAATASVDPALTDRFDYAQWVNDFYATYQRPIGHFDVMPGLRLEQVTIRTNQLTQGIRGGQSYFEAYPTFHMDYSLDQDRQLFASYSRRVARPSDQQLDPFRIFDNPLAFTQGNPRLAPAITDSYEAGYQYTKGKTFLTASLYYKDAGNVVSDVVENLGQGVTLDTFANISHTRNAGLELTAGGELTRTLSYSAGGDAAWNQISTADDGVEAPRAAAAMFGHVKLNWTATPKDFVQLSVYAQGRQIDAQGSRASWALINLGYRHQLSDRLAAELTLQDPFDEYRSRSFVETPTLTDETSNNFDVRSLQIGLTYQLGAVRKQPQPKDFDFGGGAGGGAAVPQ